MDSFFGSIANSAKERIVHQNHMNREPATVYFTKDQRHDLEERMKSRHGLHQLEAMEKLDMGTSQYKIVSLDDIHKE